MRRNETKYVLLELLSMAFLAASGIFVRYSVISPINAGMWRCLFALPVLYLMCRSELPALTKKDWLMLLAAGVMLAGDVALYNTWTQQQNMAAQQPELLDSLKQNFFAEVDGYYRSEVEEEPLK